MLAHSEIREAAGQLTSVHLLYLALGLDTPGREAFFVNINSIFYDELLLIFPLTVMHVRLWFCDWGRARYLDVSLLLVLFFVLLTPLLY